MTGWILASASPRRRETLDRLCIAHVVDPAAGDGPAQGSGPTERVLAHAIHKAREVAARHPGKVVLAADTMVFSGEDALGKPADREEAASMLQSLVAVGRHEVWTATVLVDPNGLLRGRADVARVAFTAIQRAELETYLAGDEWRDKAGAYAIQGWAGSYASLEDGWWGTVVGLAPEAVKALVHASGLPLDRRRG